MCSSDLDNPESPLFVNTGNSNYGKPFEYSSADKMLKRLCKKAGIRKLHLYLFRHSEVTRRASKLTDGNQRSRHGWSPKSTVLAKYTHLTSKDSNDSLLRAYGIEPENEKQDKVSWKTIALSFVAVIAMVHVVLLYLFVVGSVVRWLN